MERALTYPYANPGCSFVHRVGEVRKIGGDEVARALGGGERTALLAYGANAAPAALDRKLASLPGRPLPVLSAELEDFDVVYSAHVTRYGAIPATLWRSPGTTVRVHVAFPDPEQLRLIASTEVPNYEPMPLTGLTCRVEGVGELAELEAFESRFGWLEPDGSPRALAAIPAAGRSLTALSEPEILELVRSRLEPELGLEQFVAACVERGGVAPLPPLGESAIGVG